MKVAEKTYKRIIGRMEAGKIPVYPQLIRKKAFTRYKAEKEAEFKRKQEKLKREAESRRRAKERAYWRSYHRQQERAAESSTESWAQKKLHSGGWVKIRNGGSSGAGMVAMSPKDAEAQGYKWGTTTRKDGKTVFVPLPSKPSMADYYGILKWKVDEGHYKHNKATEDRIKKEIATGKARYGITTPAWSGVSTPSFQRISDIRRLVTQSYRTGAQKLLTKKEAEVKKVTTAGEQLTPEDILSQRRSLSTHPIVTKHVSAMEHFTGLDKHGSELELRAAGYKELQSEIGKRKEEFAKDGWKAREVGVFNTLAAAGNLIGKPLGKDIGKYSYDVTRARGLYQKDVGYSYDQPPPTIQKFGSLSGQLGRALGVGTIKKLPEGGYATASALKTQFDFLNVPITKDTTPKVVTDALGSYGGFGKLGGFGLDDTKSYVGVSKDKPKTPTSKDGIFAAGGISYSPGADILRGRALGIKTGAKSILSSILTPIQVGYSIGTGKYIEHETKALTAAEEARKAQGNVTAHNLGLSSGEALRLKLDTVSSFSQTPIVKNYYADQQKVSDLYTPEIEQYYKRVQNYNAITNPMQSQYDALVASKPDGITAFEKKSDTFNIKYPDKPVNVVKYENASALFFTDTGILRASVQKYIDLGEKEFTAFEAYQHKETVTREKWAPKYGKKDIYGVTFGDASITNILGGKKARDAPFWYPTIGWAAKISGPMYKGIEKYVPGKYKRTKGFLIGTGPLLVDCVGTLFPGVEMAARQPSVALKSLPLGLGLMVGGLTKSYREDPHTTSGMIAGMILGPKAAAKVSPLKFTRIEVPTGAGRLKTWYTLGKGLPKEFKGIREISGPSSPTALGRFDPTRIPFIYKQTHLIPEAVTFKGLYFRTPSVQLSLGPKTVTFKGKTKIFRGFTEQPYLGKHFLISRTTGPKTAEPAGWHIGQPYFKHLPTSYRVFSGVEAAATLPSLRRNLIPQQQKLFDAALYLQQRLGRQKGIRKPIKLEDIETFEKLPEQARADIAALLRRHRKDILIYGSSSKAAQIARKAGKIKEQGSIKPRDIDIEVLTTGSRMSEGIIMPKFFLSDYALSRIGIPTLKTALVKKLGKGVPGTTPKKLSGEIADIFKKYLGEDKVVVEYKPVWQQYSVSKIIGLKKLRLGKDPITGKQMGRDPKTGKIGAPEYDLETLFDIHAKSGTLEFGLRPQRYIRTTLDTGLKESWWTKHKTIKMSSLSDEFQRSFASVMQTQEKATGPVTKLGTQPKITYLAPRYKRMKDMSRFIQTGKMLSEYRGLRIKTSLFPFKKYRLKGVAEEQASLKVWEEYSKTFPELKEFQPDIAAKALSTSATDILRSQRIGSSMFLSESALALPRRLKFEELYKPEIPKVTKPRPKRVTGYDYYPGRRGGYYHERYPGYYDITKLKHVISPSQKRTPFLTPIKHVIKPAIKTKVKPRGFGKGLIPGVIIPHVAYPFFPPTPPPLTPPTLPPTITSIITGIFPPPSTPKLTPPTTPPEYVPPYVIPSVPPVTPSPVPPPFLEFIIPPPPPIIKHKKVKKKLTKAQLKARQKAILNPIKTPLEVLKWRM